jgi:outer membrane protein insertion porin family
MKKLFRPAQLLWVSLLFCITLFAQTGARVSKVEIKHVGPAATSDSLIRANIRVKEGDAYQRTRIDEDVKNLYGTGFFYNIRIAQENIADGVKLTYVLQGKPTLNDIKFTGNKKYSAKKLLKKISSKVGAPLDDKKLFDDAREIEKLYEKAGYHKTTAKPVLSIDENAGRGTVNFEIVETHKVRIKDIKFEGVTGFKDKKLRKVLKTKRSWMFSWLTGSNVYKEDQFEDDKDRLIEFFQNEGYIDAEIKDVKFETISKKKMIVRFIINQGQRYKVGNLTIKGSKVFSTNDILKGIVSEGKPVRMEMLVGKYFTPKGLNKDVEAIRDFYGSKGYIDARIEAEKIPNTATGTMDVVYNLEEGEKSYIEKIEIKGNEKTKDKVIRRELSVTPGEVFDMVKVKLSKERLEGLNYFEKVDTKSESTDVANRKNLVVGVEEKNTGNLTFGAGFSSVDSVVGFVEVSQSNFDLFKPPTFTGAGQKFRLRAQVGSKRQDYIMSFVEPWFLNRKLAFSVDLYHRDLDYVSREDFYSERHTGGTLGLTKALGSELLMGRVSYTLESADLRLSDATNIPPEIRVEEGARLISKVGTSLTYDTRNSFNLPNHGQRSELLTEVAGLGGDVHFYKLEARTAWYFPGFWEGHIFEAVGRAGSVASYGDGDRGADRVPIFDRWFLGGLYSLRGYRYRDIGPKANGEALGGGTYYFGSVEYSLPIIERLRFAMFYDIGNVFSQSFSFNPAGRQIYVDNWGVGVRLNLPIGPLRLDYGIPINHDNNVSGAGRFQFGVGYTREF